MHFTPQEEVAILAAAGLDKMDCDPLREQYSSNVRYYHTYQHALNVLSWVNTAAMRLFQHHTHVALGMAALYHDAVYDDLGSPENERRSADLLPREAMMARHLVMLTAEHGKIDNDIHTVSEAGAYFLDCDMAAFLCDPRFEVVLCNDMNIRKELRLVYAEKEVSEGRARFLKALYDRKYIFLSSYFRQEHERLARSNLWHLVFGGLYKKDK